MILAIAGALVLAFFVFPFVVAFCVACFGGMLSLCGAFIKGLKENI